MSDRQSRSPSHGAEADVDRALRDFRNKWPVDDSAYDFLAKAPEKIVRIVLKSFQPRGQSSYHKDYSALLTKFVQSIIERQGDKGKGKGGSRGQNNSDRRWVDFRDVRDRSHGRNRDGGHRRNRKDSRDRRESRQSRSSTRERGRRRSRQRSDDSRGKRSKNRSKDRKADARSYSVSASRGGYSDGASQAKSDDSNFSGEDAESGSEGELRKRAEKIRANGMAAAVEKQKERLAEAEEEERRISYEKVMKLVDDAEKEMSDKLAEYEDFLRAEKKAKIKQGERDVETATRRTLSALADELEEDRKREEKDVQAEFDATIQKLKDLKEEKKKDRLQKRRQRELVDAMAKKTDSRRHDGDRGDRGDRRSRSRRRGRSRSRRRGRSRSRRRASASCSRSQEPRFGSSTDLDRELRDFRNRWPVDDSAYDFLAKAPENVLKIVLESFKPRGQSSYHKDYSALLTKFTQSIMERQRYGRRGDRGEGEGKRSGGSPSQELLEFRDRYPMDDKAFDIVAAAPPEIIQKFLDGFRAKREGESDYSGLVVSFLRSVQARAKERGRD